MSILILLLVLVHQFFVYYTGGRKLDIFNIYVLIDLILVAMFVLGTNLDYDLSRLINYNFSFFIHVLAGVVGLYLGLHAFPFHRLSANQDMTPSRLRAPAVDSLKVVIAVALFSIPVLVIVRHELAVSGLGVVEYFFGGRTDEYLESFDRGKVVSSFWYILVSASRPMLLLLICGLWDSRRYKAGWIIYAIVLLGIFLIFKTRLELVITVILPIVYYHYRVRRLRMKFAFMFLPVFFVGLIALDYWRNQGVEEFSLSEVDTEQVSQSFSRDINAVRGFEMLWDLKRNDQLDQEYGANYAYIVMTVVPRALWPEKPLTAFEPRWTAKLFGDFKEGIWIFTAWGEGLTQFGLFGVFINLFLYGFVVKYAMVKFNKPHDPTILVWFYYSVLAATFLRAGFQQVFVLTLYYFIGYAIFRRIARV